MHPGLDKNNINNESGQEEGSKLLFLSSSIQKMSQFIPARQITPVK